MSLLLVSLFFNKNKETIKFQILLAPIQILKVFDLQIYSLPRMPGTVPYHHQVTLAMNSPVSILNFLRGGDNLFYEPPLFRYLLYFLNILFGSNWVLVSSIFLFIFLNLVFKLFENVTSLVHVLNIFLICLIFFSSGFLNLLLQGWRNLFLYY